MNNNNKVSINLCIDRLNAGKEKIVVCDLLYDNGFYKDANNRAYYSIFNSIRAVLGTVPIDFKRHKDVISYFNKNFVKTEIFPKELGHKISVANTVRENSDYSDYYIISKEDTKKQIETAKSISKYAEEYIRDWLKENTKLTSKEIDEKLRTNNKDTSESEEGKSLVWENDNAQYKNGEIVKNTNPIIDTDNHNNKDPKENNSPKFMTAIAFESEIAFNPEKYLGKEVFVLGYDFEGVQQDYQVFFDREEALEIYNSRIEYNRDKNYTFTLDKCIVKESELETIEHLKDSFTDIEEQEDEEEF